MKHFVRRHKHHFGLWALSGIVLIASTIWLNGLNRKSPTEPSALASQTISSSSQAQPNASGSMSSLRESNRDIANTAVASAFFSAPSVSKTPVKASSTTSGASDVAPPQEIIAVKVLIAFPSVDASFAKEITVNVKQGSTVYDVLREADVQGQMNIQFKEFAGLGAMVESIDGIKNDARANKFWIYYMNNALAKLGVSSQRVLAGDIITWNYEAEKY